MNLLFCNFISVFIATDQSLFFYTRADRPAVTGSVSCDLCRVGEQSCCSKQGRESLRTCSNSCFIFDFVIILSFKFHFGLVQEPELIPQQTDHFRTSCVICEPSWCLVHLTGILDSNTNLCCFANVNS